MDNHDFKFKWSGDPGSAVSSKLQDIISDKVMYSPDDSGNMDVANLHFKKAVVYNQVETLHVRIDATDVSHKAIPILGVKVESPQRAIHFVADLRYKADNYTAECGYSTCRELCNSRSDRKIRRGHPDSRFEK